MVKVAVTEARVARALADLPLRQAVEDGLLAACALSALLFTPYPGGLRSCGTSAGAQGAGLTLGNAGADCLGWRWVHPAGGLRSHHLGQRGSGFLEPRGWRELHPRRPPPRPGSDRGGIPGRSGQLALRKVC